MIPQGWRFGTALVIVTTVAAGLLMSETTLSPGVAFWFGGFTAAVAMASLNGRQRKGYEVALRSRS